MLSTLRIQGWFRPAGSTYIIVTSTCINIPFCRSDSLPREVQHDGIFIGLIQEQILQNEVMRVKRAKIMYSDGKLAKTSGSRWYLSWGMGRTGSVHVELNSVWKWERFYQVEKVARTKSSKDLTTSEQAICFCWSIRNIKGELIYSWRKL